MTSTPLRKACSCGPMPTPPKTAAVVSGVCTASAVEILGDLRRELARRRQHQRARRAARPADQLMQDRQQERGRLAAAGHRAGEQIASLERRRNRFSLDRCRTGEAEILESPEEVGMKLEVTKRQKILRTRESLWHISCCKLVRGCVSTEQRPIKTSPISATVG